MGDSVCPKRITSMATNSAHSSQKCNDIKFMRGTSYNAEAGLDSCK